MKLSKAFAGIAAGAVALSAMAVSVSAVSIEDYIIDGTLYLTGDPNVGTSGYATDMGIELTDIYGVTFHVTFVESELADEAFWVGGGIGANSTSTSWYSVEWGKNDKPIKPDFDNGTITWLSDAPIFTSEEEFAHLWLQTWGGTVTVTGAELLGKGGNVIREQNIPSEAPDTEQKAPAAADTAAETPAKSPDTGNTPVSVMTAVLSLSALSAFSARRKKMP